MRPVIPNGKNMPDITILYTLPEPMLLVVALVLLACGIAAFYTFKEIEKNPRGIKHSLRRFVNVTDSILSTVRSIPPEDEAPGTPEDQLDDGSETNSMADKETVNP